MLLTNRDTLRSHCYRVLIVDDHADTIESLAAMFVTLGHQTRGTRYGHEALRIASSFEPDLILLDIQLPDINGYEVVRLMRASSRLRECFIVAITGWSLTSDAVRALSLGFDKHMTKPFDVVELRQILRSVAVRSRMKN